MIDYLKDPKTLTAIATAIVSLVVQLGKKHGLELDDSTANSITLALVAIAGALMASHAHVEHAEVHADAHVEAATVTAEATKGAGKVASLLLAFVLITGLAGCTAAQVATAEADFHAASSTALGLLTAAAAHPELLEEAKGAVAIVAAKADPKDADAIGAALAHVTAGNAAQGALILAPFVAASAPKGSAP